jgi:hypothetical protein
MMDAATVTLVANVFIMPAPASLANTNTFGLDTTTLVNPTLYTPPPKIPDRFEQCQSTVHPVEGVPNGWLSVVTCPDEAKSAADQGRERTAEKRFAEAETKQWPPEKLTLRCSGVLHGITEFTSKPYDEKITDHEIIFDFVGHNVSFETPYEGTIGAWRFPIRQGDERDQPSMHVIFAGNNGPTGQVVRADWAYGDLDRGTGNLSIFWSKAKALPGEYVETWRFNCRVAKPLF